MNNNETINRLEGLMRTADYPCGSKQKIFDEDAVEYAIDLVKRDEVIKPVRTYHSDGHNEINIFECSSCGSTISGIDSDKLYFCPTCGQRWREMKLSIEEVKRILKMHANSTHPCEIDCGAEDTCAKCKYAMNFAINYIEHLEEVV